MDGVGGVGEDFAANYAALNGLSLTAEEAGEVARRVSADRKATASALEMAAKLKDRLASCPSTAGQQVVNFVGGGAGDALAKLQHLLKNWHCPDDGSPKKVEENGVDGYVRYFSKLRSVLEANPGAALQTGLAYLHGRGWISRDVMPIAQMLAGYLEGAPDKIEYLASALDYFEKFVGTESGRRALRAVPKLATASADEALEIFKHEADFNQEIFFSLMANSDLAENFLKKVARRLINGIQYCRSLLEDDLKFAILNSVFISNNVPPLNRRNLLKSSMDTFEKLTHKYTPFIETTNYYESVRALQEEIERDYFRFDDLSRLSDEEMENALGGFLEDNFVSPARDAWLANRQVTSGSPRCAEQLACLYSRNHRRQGPIVRWIARAFASTLR